MNIKYVLSLPVYHELTDNDGFLELANSDKWFPSLMTQKGYPTELWAAGTQAYSADCQYDDLPALTVRLFGTDSQEGDPKKHTSDSLNQAIRNAEVDFVIIKGLDGEIGIQLAKQVLIPSNIPFAVIVDGTCYHPVIKHAVAVLYETEWQRQLLTKRSFRFWRTVLDDRKLIHLAKSVDIRHFAPDHYAKKDCDVIGMQHVLSPTDKLEALIELSKYLKIGVIGGGSELYNYRKRYPEINWFGAVPYSQVPELMNRGKLFFYGGVRSDHPRAVSEAAACGLPIVTFEGAIHGDVMPDQIGLRVSRKSYVSEITDLLENKQKLKQLSDNARAYAEKEWHHQSSLPAVRKLLQAMVPYRT